MHLGDNRRCVSRDVQVPYFYTAFGFTGIPYKNLQTSFGALRFQVDGQCRSFGLFEVIEIEIFISYDGAACVVYYRITVYP